MSFPLANYTIKLLNASLVAGATVYMAGGCHSHQLRRWLDIYSRLPLENEHELTPVFRK